MTLEARVIAGFRAAYGRSPQVLAFAPGRVNLIGEHTDYNDGFVLPCALEQGTMVAVARRDDRRISVRALDLAPDRAGASVDAPEDIFGLEAAPAPLAAGHWANHPRGLVAAWLSSGYALPGLDIAIAGDLPRGAGLSSSASLGVALGAAFARVAGATVDAAVLARLAQRAENDTVGCACGIMDPLVSAAGREGVALLIDCRALAWEEVAVADDIAVLVVHSGVSRELADGAYNQRRAECERAARSFGVAALRDLAPSALAPAAHAAAAAHAPCGLDEVAFRRARHVVTENARAQAFAAALRRHDLVAAGAALRASHASLRDDFEVSHPAVDALVAALDAAIGDEGGARMTGGGFGGCVVAVLSRARVAAVRAAAREHLRAAGVVEPLTLEVRPSGGAVAWDAPRC
ncbi:MAG: galactokinase [Gammaproteobacteria bacterium]